MITHALTIPITQCEQPGQQLIIKKGHDDNLNIVGFINYFMKFYF